MKHLILALAVLCTATAAAETFAFLDYNYARHLDHGDEGVLEARTEGVGGSVHVFGDVFYTGASLAFSDSQAGVGIRVGATSGAFTPYISYLEHSFVPTSVGGEEPTDTPGREHVFDVDIGVFYVVDNTFRFNVARSVGNNDRVNYGIGFIASPTGGTAYTMNLHTKRGFTLGIGRRF